MTLEAAILDLSRRWRHLPSAAGVGSLLSQQGVDADVGTIQVTLESLAKRSLLVRDGRGWARPREDPNG